MEQLRKSSVTCFCSVFLIVSIAGFCCAQETKKDLGSSFDLSNFTYSSENRRNPFEPLYLLKIKSSGEELKSVKKGYELEELKLVGIVKANQNRLAMMEDMQGRGIIFKRGDFLNNNLWIADVVDSRVILAYKLKDEVKRINIDIPKR